MERRTAQELWRDAVRDAPAEPAYLEETAEGWQPVSWQEAAERVEELSRGLLARGVRRGDRVVVKTQTGEVMAKLLARMTAQRIELKSLNPSYEDRSFALNEIVFVHRIIWASQ